MLWYFFFHFRNRTSGSIAYVAEDVLVDRATIILSVAIRIRGRSTFRRVNGLVISLGTKSVKSYEIDSASIGWAPSQYD